MPSDNKTGAVQRDRNDPRTLTVEQLLDTLKASEGFLVVCFRGVGVSTYYKYNPGRNGYEQIEARNAPEETDQGLLIKTETMSHGLFNRERAEDCLQNWMGPSVEGFNVEFVRYDESAFTAVEGSPELWGAFGEDEA